MKPPSTEPPSASEAFEAVVVALDTATEGRLSPEALHEGASRQVMAMAQRLLAARPLSIEPELGFGQVTAWIEGVLGEGDAVLDNLGTVYEALLDCAVVRRATGKLSVEETPRRRRSGVHYTPRSLTRSIVEVTLRPLVTTSEGELRPPEVILGLRICDPAMGCGAFLLEAARALSGWLRLAADVHGEALDDGEIRRRVVASVLYGVDVDPVAVSVARAALDLFAGGEGVSGSHLVHGDALARGCGEGREWSRRFAEVFERPEARGFDAILSNPPYLFGARRPVVEKGDFDLCEGQWDAWWLFVERGAAWSARGRSSFGYALPDALLTRESTLPLRVFLRGCADQLWLRHEGAVFSAAVSVVACCGWHSGERPSMAFERVTEEGTSRSIHPLTDDVEASCVWWPPVEGGGLGVSVKLGDLIRISRGEEVGKSSLRRLGEGPAADEVAILAGEGVSRAYEQPEETHAIERGRVSKASRHYEAPKIVVVKTGQRLRAAIDRRGVLTLQSLYNVHLSPEAPPWATLEFVCGLLNANAVDERFIRPITSGKKLFPQITQRMIRDIRLPEPDADQAALIVGLVRSLEEGVEPEAEVALQSVFDTLFSM